MSRRTRRSHLQSVPADPDPTLKLRLAAAETSAKAALQRLDAASDARMERVERQDRWVNWATFQGTFRDKTRAGYFEQPIRLTDVEITALASGNDLAAKAIEKRPREMFRRGYNLEPDGGDEIDKSDIEDVRKYAIEKLQVDIRMRQGMVYGRQYGGSILILGINDGREPWEPVDEKNIKSVDFVNQVDRRFSYVQSYYSDYMSPQYGEPETYLVSNAVATSTYRSSDNSFRMKKKVGLEKGKNTGTSGGYSILNVHESRIIRFDGVEPDVITRQMLAGWSWSVLQRAYETLRLTDMAFDSLAYLISDASQGVMKLKGLLKALSIPGGKEKYERRMELVDESRSVIRSIAVDPDGGEDFTRVTTPLTGIPDAVDRLMQRLAAALDMPVTELFGISPAGLNATGASDREHWYDTIATDQENELAPKLKRLYRLLALSKQGPLGGKDLNWKIKFNPLHTPTDDDIAKTRFTNAQRDALYITNQVVTAEEVAVTLDDVYPHLDVESREAAIKGATSFDGHENDPEPGPPGGTPDPTGGAGGSGDMPEGQSPTVPLPGSALHTAVSPAGEGEGTPGDAGTGNARLGKPGAKKTGKPNGTPATSNAAAPNGEPGTKATAAAGPGETRTEPNDDIPPAKGVPHVVVHPDQPPSLHASKGAAKKHAKGISKKSDVKAKILPAAEFLQKQQAWSAQKHPKTGQFTAKAKDDEQANEDRIDREDLYVYLVDAETVEADPEIDTLESGDHWDSKDLADDVYAQLAPDYPEKAIAWVKALPWKGPKTVSLEKIDFGARAHWKAAHDDLTPYKEKVANGQLKPIILVKRPSSKLLMCADGHHRLLTYEAMGRAPLAYIAISSKNTGPFDEMHSLQKSGLIGSNQKPGSDGDGKVGKEDALAVTEPSVLGPHSHVAKDASTTIPEPDPRVVANLLRNRPSVGASNAEEEPAVLTPEPEPQSEPLQEAAIGILRKGNLVLCVRAREGWRAKTWQLPGGMIEPGESVEAALRRELAEEVGIVAMTVEHALDFQNSGRPVHAYIVTSWTGEVQVDGVEIADARWMMPVALQARAGRWSGSVRKLIRKGPLGPVMPVDVEMTPEGPRPRTVSFHNGNTAHRPENREHAQPTIADADDVDEDMTDAEEWLAKTIGESFADALEEYANGLSDDEKQDDADWDEGKHPREKDGKFGSGGGGAEGEKSAPAGGGGRFSMKTALHAIVAGIRAAPAAIGRLVVHEAKEKVKEFKNAGLGVKHFLTGQPVSHEEKNAIKKVAVFAVTSILASHLVPLLPIGAVVHGELASLATEKVTDQILHHVFEGFAKKSLHLDWNENQERDERGRFGSGSGGNEGSGPKAGSLFRSKSTEGLGEKALQTEKDPEKIFAQAKEAHEQSLDLLNRGKGLVKDIGATMVRGDQIANVKDFEKKVAEVSEKPGPAIVIGPMKTQERSAEKVAADGGKDGWSSLTDVVRATVAVDSMKQVGDVVKHLEDRGMKLAQLPKDRFENPTDAHYRDLMLKVAYPNGHVGEIQVQLKPMLEAKSEAHKFYETTRSLEPAMAARSMTKDQWKTYDGNMRSMQKIYDSAWQKAGGRGDEGLPVSEPAPKKDAGDFDESKHPREANGQFGEGGGGEGGTPKAGSEAVEIHPASAKDFHEAFTKAFEGNPLSGYVTHYSPEQLAGMKTFLTPDGKAGVAVHDHGDGRVEATALFNQGGPPGAGVALMHHAIDSGGANYCECFGDRLREKYEGVGFKVETKSPFDPQYAPKDWDYAKFKTPPYYTMRLSRKDSDDDFESKHPRGPDGKFGSGGVSASGPKVGDISPHTGMQWGGKIAGWVDPKAVPAPEPKTGSKMVDALPVAPVEAPGGDDPLMGAKSDEEFQARSAERTKDAGPDEPIRAFTSGSGMWYDIRAYEKDPVGFAASHPRQVEAWAKMKASGDLRPDEQKFGSAAEKAAHDLQGFFAKATPTPGVVYRGIAADDAKIHALLEHHTLTMPATSSASREPNVAIHFGRTDVRLAKEHGQTVVPAVLRLRQQSGVAVEHLSNTSSEREVMLPKGTSFRITGRGQTGGFLVIDAEEIARKRDAGDDWDEGKHPRDEKGRFGSGGGTPPGGGPLTRGPQEFGKTLTPSGRVRQADPQPVARPDLNAPSPKTIDAFHFASINVEPAAAMTVDQVVGVTEHPELSQWLDRQPMNERPQLEIVKETPNVVTESGSGHTIGLYWSPRYDAMTDTTSKPRLQVAVGDKTTAGTPYLPSQEKMAHDWGDTWTVGDRGESVKNERGFASGKFDKSPRAFVHDVFLHELGHHIEMGPAARKYDGEGDHATIRGIVENAYDKRFTLTVGELRERGVPESKSYAAAITNGDVKSPAISRYAATNPHEYFAESFNAYVTHPKDLEAHDKVGYWMVKTVLTLLGVEGQGAAGPGVNHSGRP